MRILLLSLCIFIFTNSAFSQNKIICEIKYFEKSSKIEYFLVHEIEQTSSSKDSLLTNKIRGITKLKSVHDILKYMISLKWNFTGSAFDCSNSSQILYFDNSQMENPDKIIITNKKSLFSN